MPAQDNASTLGAQAESLNVSHPSSLRALGERRVLTALSYDLVGSTRLLETLGIEDFQDLQLTFQSEVQRAIAANGGEVRDEAGDGGIALFDAELDPKDAAALAVSAGFAIIAACLKIGRELRRKDIHVRIGIATSIFVVQDAVINVKSTKLTGAALALATRIQSLAHPNSIFVSNETRKLVRRSHAFTDRGMQQLKGFSEPQQVWCAVRHKRDVDRFFAFGRMSAPMVNRKADMLLVSDLWAGVAKGKGQVLLVSGEAGIGKSRFVHQLRVITRKHRENLLLFQCLPGSARSTLHPLIQRFPKSGESGSALITSSTISRQFREIGVTDTEVIRIFSFLLGARSIGKEFENSDPEEIRRKANWAVQRSLELISKDGPLAIVVEDVHWIDPTTRQLIAEVSTYIANLPVFLVLTSRPEEHTDWLDKGSLNTLQLKRLSSEGVEQAVRHFAQSHNLPFLSEMVDLIVRVSGGVPLFIEEMCQWVSENQKSASEALATQNLQNHFSAFESVIEARLSALGFAGDVARATSVIGNKFDRALAVELLPDSSSERIGEALEGLCRAGFLIQVRPTGEPLYGFRHALVQETIYNTQLKKQKRVLHGRLFASLNRNRALASWIETSALAEHAERAGQIEDAIGYFVIAGDESASRSAMVEARQLLEHSLSLCDQLDDTEARDRARLSATIVLGPVLTSTEGPSSAPARKIYDEGVEIARLRPMEERAQWFPVYWGWWFTGEEINGERAHALLAELKDVDDPEVQLQARHCVWAMDFNLGHHANCIASIEAGLPLYDRPGRINNPRQFGGHDTKVCGLIHWGLSLWFRGQPSRAVALAVEAKALATASGHVGTIAHALNNSAMLNCYRRDFASLRADIDAMRALTGSNKLPSLEATAIILEGWCLGLEGKPESGRDLMRKGMDAHHALQTPEDYPVYCSLLAEVLALTTEFDQAIKLVDAAVSEAQQTGHLYWLSELYHRKALLMIMRKDEPRDIALTFKTCFACAIEHGATAILLTAFEHLEMSRLAPELVAEFRGVVSEAKATVEAGAALFANPTSLLAASR